MPTDKPEVIITDVKMSFWSMVVFMVKWAIASIPAFIILILVGLLFISPFTAIPRYTAYKQQANDSQMKSTLHDAATAMEARYGGAANSYLGTTVAELDKFGFSPKPGVTLEILKATSTAYVLRASGTGGTVRAWLFDSETGMMTPES